MSLPQYSNTSRCACSLPHTARPVASSIHTARCSVLTLIGDLPGMNQVVARSLHSSFGRSPLAAQTCTLARFAGIARAGSPGSRPWLRRLSTMLKNSGAAVCTPTSAGFELPSKLPTHTISTLLPNTPAVHASRKPQEVPVFHATRGNAGWPVSGRGLACSMSTVMNAASGLNSLRVVVGAFMPAVNASGFNSPPLASVAYIVASSSMLTSPPPSASARP